MRLFSHQKADGRPYPGNFDQLQLEITQICVSKQRLSLKLTADWTLKSAK